MLTLNRENINILESCKYKRECIKCRSIEIEMTDLFNEHDMLHLPIIQLMQKGNMRKEYIYHKIKNRMMSVNKIYNDEINK